MMSAFSPVHARRTFEEAVEQIAERISLGELAPGDQLPTGNATIVGLVRTVSDFLKPVATRASGRG
jgi:pyridoxine 5'-phosphate synthase PdxJ